MEASAASRRISVPRSRRLLAALGDDRLVDQLRRGHEAAFEVIYDRHHRGVLSFCRHMLGSPEEAEDVVQHTFTAAYRSIVGSDREIRVAPWLYAIARNRCISVLRARREQPSEPPEVATAGLADEVQRRSDLQQLLSDLHDLPEEQRAALVLAEMGDLAHAQVAEVLGVEVGKVKSLVFQARTALMERREARDIPCTEIRRELATARGAALRRGPLRRHLKDCEGCAAFREEVRRQRRMMAVLLPVVPSVGLKRSVLAATGIGGGGAAGGGLVAGGGGVLGGVASSGAAKVAVVAIVAGGAATGAGVSVVGGSGPEDRAGEARLLAADPASAAEAVRLASPERGGLDAARRSGQDDAWNRPEGWRERRREAKEKQERRDRLAARGGWERGGSKLGGRSAPKGVRGPRSKGPSGGGGGSGGGGDALSKLPKPPKTEAPSETPTLPLPETGVVPKGGSKQGDL